MLKKESNGIAWLEFELLADLPLVHGCVLRHGGVSEGAYHSLNLSANRDSARENINENYRRLAQAMGLRHIIPARGCHGDRVVAVDSHEEMPPISDGISTNVAEIALLVTQADCQGAIFYDPVLHAVANVHSGWRGSVQNIYGNAVDHMRERYGSKPEDLLVCVSPSLGPQSAEFVNYKTELPESFWQYQVKPHYFDFWAISEAQLKESGVLSDHIQIAKIDTYSNPQDYFSYRRENDCGRQATVCRLKAKV